MNKKGLFLIGLTVFTLVIAKAALTIPHSANEQANKNPVEQVGIIPDDDTTGSAIVDAASALVPYSTITYEQPLVAPANVEVTPEPISKNEISPVAVYQDSPAAGTEATPDLIYLKSGDLYTEELHQKILTTMADQDLDERTLQNYREIMRNTDIAEEKKSELFRTRIMMAVNGVIPRGQPIDELE